MKLNQAKALLVRKLLTAKYFILITEKEAFMQLRGANPKKVKDFLALLEQRASLALFQQQVEETITEHDKALDAMEQKPKKSKAKSVKKPKKA